MYFHEDIDSSGLHSRTCQASARRQDGTSEQAAFEPDTVRATGQACVTVTESEIVHALVTRSSTNAAVASVAPNLPPARLVMLCPLWQCQLSGIHAQSARETLQLPVSDRKRWCIPEKCLSMMLGSHGEICASVVAQL